MCRLKGLNPYQRGSVFGATIVALAFAFALAKTPQPTQGLGNAERTEKISQIDSSDQQPDIFWPWVTEDAAGFFTFCLFLVGCIQALLFFQQLRFIHKDLANGIKAANAAMKSADALISSERAHVLFKTITISDVEAIDKTGVKASPKVRYTLTNSGKSPAWIRKTLFKVDIRKKDDSFPLAGAEPDYGCPRATIDTNIPIPPGEDLDTFEAFSIPKFEVDQAAATRLLGGDLYLTIYGYIEYADIFEKKEGLRCSGFCYQYRFGQNVPVPSNAPKYWKYT